MSCPVEYRYFGGSCYRYYQWLSRHYKPDEYHFQESWHKALLQCERENGTLASIQSEEEAYYIKVGRLVYKCVVTYCGRSNPLVSHDCQHQERTYIQFISSASSFPFFCLSRHVGWPQWFSTIVFCHPPFFFPLPPFSCLQHPSTLSSVFIFFFVRMVSCLLSSGRFSVTFRDIFVSPTAPRNYSFLTYYQTYLT